MIIRLHFLSHFAVFLLNLNTSSSPLFPLTTKFKYKFTIFHYRVLLWIGHILWHTIHRLSSDIDTDYIFFYPATQSLTIHVSYDENCNLKTWCVSEIVIGSLSNKFQLTPPLRKYLALLPFSSEFKTVGWMLRKNLNFRKWPETSSA